jgi:hypothetical protein
MIDLPSAKVYVRIHGTSLPLHTPFQDQVSPIVAPMPRLFDLHRGQAQSPATRLQSLPTGGAGVPSCAVGER